MEAIKEEVDKLLAAGFIEPCDYPKWLANVITVKKPNGSWRMRVDFTNLWAQKISTLCHESTD